LWLNAPDLAAFSLFHQSPDTANSNEEKTGSGTNARGAIILRYQQRTERVDEAILRFLSEAA
jgi:hypothetical protein